MDYGLAMHCDGSGLRRSLRPALLGAALACGAHALFAGEPIRFSGRAGSPAPQDFDRREPLLPAEVRAFARPNVAMDSLQMPPQTVTPTTGLTRRQLEAQEQKRNWIFQSSETILKQASERDDDKSRRDDREKPKSSAERFLEGADSKADPADQSKSADPAHKSNRDRKDNAGNSSRSPRDPRDPRSDSAKSGENSTSLETRASATQRGSEERSLFNAADARGGSVGRTMSESRDRERQRERDANLDAFKRSLNNPWAQPAATGVDPARPGGSAVPGNAGLPTTGFDRRSTAGALGQAGRSAMDFAPRGGLGGFDPKNPLNYGTADTVLKNQEPPRAASKPVVLEIPKRKF
ncbi:MAG: hypothetical protein HZA92_03020 [Verrucomicrobia bacterium]|nr:hypothetical protein [Verrucomicrobiota bacterium]